MEFNPYQLTATHPHLHINGPRRICMRPFPLDFFFRHSGLRSMPDQWIAVVLTCHLTDLF